MGKVREEFSYAIYLSMWCSSHIKFAELPKKLFLEDIVLLEKLWNKNVSIDGYYVKNKILFFLLIVLVIAR